MRNHIHLRVFWQEPYACVDLGKRYVAPGHPPIINVRECVRFRYRIQCWHAKIHVHIYDRCLAGASCAGAWRVAGEQGHHRRRVRGVSVPACVAGVCGGNRRSRRGGHAAPCRAGISFVLVTVLRKEINAPRPYEVFDAAPVIPKDTRGNSFPSRHAFSIFVIAMTFCACCPLAWAGPVMLAAGVLLAVIRVVSGVHFPCDVVVGALLGMLAGFVGLWIL